MERAKGFEPSTLNLQTVANQHLAEAAKTRYTQIRAQIPEELERLHVFRAWPKLPPQIRESIVRLVMHFVEEEEVRE